MTFKLKRGLLTPAAEATTEDFIIVDNDCTTADDCDDVAPAVSASRPLAQLEDMERYAQLALQTVASTAAKPLRPAKGAYVHYIPQFYLH